MAARPFAAFLRSALAIRDGQSILQEENLLCWPYTLTVTAADVTHATATVTAEDERICRREAVVARRNVRHACCNESEAVVFWAVQVNTIREFWHCTGQVPPFLMAHLTRYTKAARKERTRHHKVAKEVARAHKRLRTAVRLAGHGRETSIEEAIYALGRDNDAVKTDNNALKRDNDALKRDNDAMKRENAALRAENNAMRKDNDATKRVNDTLREESEAMQRDHDATSTRLENQNHQLLEELGAAYRLVMDANEEMLAAKKAREHWQARHDALIRCDICLEPRSRPLATACGHVFCGSCITRSLETSGRCPYCRKAISERGFRRLYQDPDHAEAGGHLPITVGQPDEEALVEVQEYAGTHGPGPYY